MTVLVPFTSLKAPVYVNLHLTFAKTPVPPVHVPLPLVGCGVPVERPDGPKTISRARLDGASGKVVHACQRAGGSIIGHVGLRHTRTLSGLGVRDLHQVLLIGEAVRNDVVGLRGAAPVSVLGAAPAGVAINPMLALLSTAVPTMMQVSFALSSSNLCEQVIYLIERRTAPLRASRLEQC